MRVLLLFLILYSNAKIEYSLNDEHKIPIEVSAIKDIQENILAE
jgi:hypothetical protein